jgi:hypothetical protein
VSLRSMRMDMGYTRGRIEMNYIIYIRPHVYPMSIRILILRMDMGYTRGRIEMNYISFLYALTYTPCPYAYCVDTQDVNPPHIPYYTDTA